MTPIFTMILLIAIVISASLAGIIIRHARNESRRKKMEAAFDSMAAQFDFFISRKEVPGNRVIGLDEKTNRLLYCSVINGKHEGYLVHMNELRKVAIKRDYKLIPPTFRYASSMEPQLNAISLELHYRKGASPLALPFYIHGNDSVKDIRERIKTVTFWHSLLSKKLRRADRRNETTTKLIQRQRAKQRQVA